MPDETKIPLEDACARIGGLYKADEGQDPYCDVSQIEHSSDAAITMRVTPVVTPAPQAEMRFRAEETKAPPPPEVTNDGPPTEPQDGV